MTSVIVSADWLRCVNLSDVLSADWLRCVSLSDVLVADWLRCSDLFEDLCMCEQQEVLQVRVE